MGKRNSNKVIILGSIISMISSIIGWSAFLVIDQFVVLSQNRENFSTSYFITNLVAGSLILIIPSLLAGGFLTRVFLSESCKMRLSAWKIFSTGSFFGLLIGITMCVLVWMAIGLISLHRGGPNLEGFIYRSFIGITISMIGGELVGDILYILLIKNASYK